MLIINSFVLTLNHTLDLCWEAHTLKSSTLHLSRTLTSLAGKKAHTSTVHKHWRHLTFIIVYFNVTAHWFKNLFNENRYAIFIGTPPSYEQF